PTNAKKITKQRTAKKIKEPKKPPKPRGRPRGSGKNLYAVQVPSPLSDTGNLEHVLGNSDQVEVTESSAVSDNTGVVDDVSVVVGDEAPDVAEQAPAPMADGAAIAQQRVKDRAIAQGRSDLVPFVERYKVPVGLTNNEINLLLSAMSEVVNEALEKKERWKQEMRDAVWKWIGELASNWKDVCSFEISVFIDKHVMLKMLKMLKILLFLDKYNFEDVEDVEDVKMLKMLKILLFLDKQNVEDVEDSVISR
ncbi:hypothetical protein BDK51DRAFT_33609, partial [Blyttiomyces helicus]